MSKPRRLPPQIHGENELARVFGTIMPYIGLIAVLSIASYGFWLGTEKPGSAAITIASMIILSAATFGLTWLARKDFGGPRSAKRANSRQSAPNARERDAA